MPLQPGGRPADQPHASPGHPLVPPQATCVIGNGVVVHLPGLFEEIRGMQARARRVP